MILSWYIAALYDEVVKWMYEMYQETVMIGEGWEISLHLKYREFIKTNKQTNKQTNKPKNQNKNILFDKTEW